MTNLFASQSRVKPYFSISVVINNLTFSYFYCTFYKETKEQKV